MKGRVVVVAVAAAVLAAARVAVACDCPTLKAPTAAVRTEAPIIFEGDVVEILDRSLHITRKTPGDTTGETRPLGREVVFQVRRVWAGTSSRRVSLFMDESDCAVAFEPGRRYVVFARRDAKGRPTTSVCMRTMEADQAQAVVRALGPSRRPGHRAAP
jgi:hypothetical protein